MTPTQQHIEYNIEHHYEHETDKNIYLQFLENEQTYFKNRLEHCLNEPYNELFFNMLLVDYEYHNPELDFQFLATLKFKSFFKNNYIDIPRCFRKTFSVRRDNTKIFLLKFNNYFMRSGLKTKYYTILNRVFSQIFENYKNINYNPNSEHNFLWKELFILTNTLNIDRNSYKILKSPKTQETSYSHRLSPLSKKIYSEWDILDVIFKNTIKLTPVFLFYIYKVDKKIFKNTRGKSGKYTFIWKYIAPYKRFFIVMHWLFKELRIKSGKTLDIRLHNLLNDLMYSPEKLWIYKIKKFSYNYVYRNCRHTLAETYRTVTK